MGKSTDTVRKSRGKLLLGSSTQHGKLIDMKNGGKYKTVSIAPRVQKAESMDVEAGDTAAATATTGEKPTGAVSLSRPFSSVTAAGRTGSLNPQPRSTPVSGRAWKTPESTKHSATTRKPTLGTTSWAKVKAAKLARQLAQQQSKMLKEASIEEAKRERQRLKESRQRKAANEARGEIVVPITDTKKLKSMSRKALRQIKKA